MRIPILFLLAAAASVAALPEPVRIDSGPLEGVPSAVPGVTAFEGIPYAAAPLGELRWTPPQPATKWPVVRNADRFMPACPQNYMGPDSTAFFGDYEAKSKDCLFLNIWTPAKSSGDKLPVLVWIHGGGFRVGSGTERLHHGEHLAAKGVVLVTLNYRLGVFGFLAHPDLTKESESHTSGNYGLMDQVAALQWVKRNIAAFGGDLNRVAIFGESAGSGNVSLMQASPLAKNLFHAAVGESGALETKTSGKKAYQYYFSHGPPFPTGQPFARDVSKLGAHHSVEIIYVFNNLDIRTTRDWPYTAWDRKLADMMSSYCVNFAATGDPNGKGLPVWPVWSEKDTRVMEFGDKAQAAPSRSGLLGPGQS